MASVVQICNMALMRVGNSQTITTLSEASVEARICSTFYEQTRDHLLQAFDWGFARKRATLAELAGTVPTNWTYMYSLPSGCLNVRRIITEGARLVRSDMKVPFEVANVSGQKVLLTDMEDVEIEYTAQVTDTTLFDPAFVSALSYRLALEIAMPLTVKGEIVQQLRAAYSMAVSEAAALNMNEAQDDPEPDGSFLASREMSSQIHDGRIIRG